MAADFLNGYNVKIFNVDFNADSGKNAINNGIDIITSAIANNGIVEIKTE